MPTELRQNIQDEFYASIAQPIIDAIRNETSNLRQPRAHVSPNGYARLLQCVHNCAMLAWRTEAEQLTLLSRYADKLFFTLFAISKDRDQHCLIYCPMLANAAAPKQPKAEFHNPRTLIVSQPAMIPRRDFGWMRLICFTTYPFPSKYGACFPCLPSHMRTARSWSSLICKRCSHHTRIVARLSDLCNPKNQ